MADFGPKPTLARVSVSVVWPTLAKTDFGQTDFGQPFLLPSLAKPTLARVSVSVVWPTLAKTDFGQTDFGQTDFGQNTLKEAFGVDPSKGFVHKRELAQLIAAWEGKQGPVSNQNQG